MVEPRPGQLNVDKESFGAFIDLLARLIARRHRMMTVAQADQPPHAAALSMGARPAPAERRDQLGQAG